MGIEICVVLETETRSWTASQDQVWQHSSTIGCPFLFWMCLKDGSNCASIWSPSHIDLDLDLGLASDWATLVISNSVAAWQGICFPWYCSHVYAPVSLRCFWCFDPSKKMDGQCLFCIFIFQPRAEARVKLIVVFANDKSNPEQAASLLAALCLDLTK